MPRALITGITGQDGSYLTEFLLDKGYEVFGLARDPSRLEEGLRSRTEVLTAEMTEEGSLRAAVATAAPDEIYHLAARSVPADGRADPVGTIDVNATGTVRLLEAVRAESPTARICYASSSEVFARTDTSPQDESTEFAPRNLYGLSKMLGHLSVRHYREALGVHVATAVLFNHESPRRPANFVTRKVTMAAAEISLGRRKTVALGDLDARRDWGFAGDYVEAMWLMLQRDDPDEYVIGTGTTHSVADLCAGAFEAVGLDWRDHVTTDPDLVREPESTVLVSNPAKALKVLGWSARTPFDELIAQMVRADVHP